MNVSKHSIITNIRSNRAIRLPLILLSLFIIILIVNMVVVNKDTEWDKQYLTHSGELRVLSQQIAKFSSETQTGDENAFLKLSEGTKKFETSWTAINDGDARTDLPGLRNKLKVFNNLQLTWDKMKKNAELILASKKEIQSIRRNAQTINKNILNLQSEFNDVSDILLENNATTDQVLNSYNQAYLSERMNTSIQQILEGGEKNKEALSTFIKDVNTFGRTINGMLEGDKSMNIKKVTDEEAITFLVNIQSLYGNVRSKVDAIKKASPKIVQVRNAADSIFIDSEGLLNQTSQLDRSIKSLADNRLMSPMSAYLFSMLCVLSFLWIVNNISRETQHRLLDTARTNERNQEAILRLLDELAGLADGDLTTTATVSEDFTGAIADSINYTVDQLRVLVSSINEVSNQVTNAALDTQKTALSLTEASEYQAQEISKATVDVNEMAKSIDQVSNNAGESSGVAKRSVEFANEGAEAVRNTIDGMNTIREQIQDTSKRIKRLGESSQEIGNIVSLINDIAEQTNILALNAAIQASMAGEAGRGFAVVADEVQRLAERSGNATKQIENLVQTIQRDTAEAVRSMEQTTTEVVQGARLAQEAGVALDKIENVSNDLANLIQNISNAANQQTDTAKHITETMDVIQDITKQTSEVTNATASSIGNLANLAEEMRSSVAGFKLPSTIEELEGPDESDATMQLEEPNVIKLGVEHQQNNDGLNFSDDDSNDNDDDLKFENA